MMSTSNPLHHKFSLLLTKSVPSVPSSTVILRPYLLLFILLASCPVRVLSLRSVDYRISKQCGPHVSLHEVHVLQSFQGRSDLHCAVRCEMTAECVSFDFDNGAKMCSLGGVPFYTDCSNSVVNGTNHTLSGDVRHFEQVFHPPQCLNGGRSSDDVTCQCPDGTVGALCERFVTDCADWLSIEPSVTGHKVRWIKPLASPQPFQVYCRLDSGNTRLYLLRRSSTNSEDFGRLWGDYRDGFGSLDGDFWLGLDKMHALTAGPQRYDLRMRYTVAKDDGSGKTENAYETYDYFRVGDEWSNYQLSLTPNPNPDCLSRLNGVPFSTKDRDNDGVEGITCSRRHGSGWWFTNRTCSEGCNPTGTMVTGSPGGNRTGLDTDVFWLHKAPSEIDMYLMPLV